MVEGYDHLELAMLGDGEGFLLRSRNVRVQLVSCSLQS